MNQIDESNAYSNDKIASWNMKKFKLENLYLCKILTYINFFNKKLLYDNIRIVLLIENNDINT